MSTTNCLSYPDPFLSLNLTLWFLKSFLKLHPGNQILMQIKRHLKNLHPTSPTFGNASYIPPEA